MSSAADTDIVCEDVARRERAKARLYLLFQAGSWGFFWLFQIVLLATALAPRPGAGAADRFFQVSINTMVMALGLLLTHFGRRVIARRGWKSLGWRPLVPRIVALSAVQSTIWVTVGLGWPYLIVGHAWPSSNSWPVIALLLWLNGICTLLGWHCVYFFYHLYDRFNRLEIERLRLRTSVKEAELRALKSQINPHFIFNALNSLRALIDEDPARARLAVTQLANLLRYSLQSAQAETVAFEDELRVVNDYLALEQVRHEERLRVRLDIAPETLGLAVPPLLLQTLVENAVKYGISARPEGGEILVQARCEAGQLRLRVTNPGSLAPANAGAFKAGSTGLGLKNAAERLRLFFGERASLQVRAESASLVVAEVSLPGQLTRA
ncbi:MAG TPA: histidine kinase [Opitutaceae bacterium]|nr:histidine kinase [Opitutaceae bacterium]